MEFKCKEFSLNHTLSSMKVGTDAILLSSLVERNHKKHILEIGTGCGIISLAMAQLNKTAKITSIDIDEESIKQVCNKLDIDFNSLSTLDVQSIYSKYGININKMPELLLEDSKKIDFKIY